METGQLLQQWAPVLGPPASAHHLDHRLPPRTHSSTPSAAPASARAHAGTPPANTDRTPGGDPHPREHDVLDGDVARLSPIQHVNLDVLDRYSVRASVPADGGLRPLRDPVATGIDDEDGAEDRRGPGVPTEALSAFAFVLPSDVERVP
ncbi:hypothetical protein ACFVT1_31290 [Streptomyces sp. NPDC057963]|uniref:hypothetical protein n=1 Tax=Streptomyces sp. NPDC057963 TaxID=3346290 RepID=UPI0036EBEF6C